MFYFRQGIRLFILIVTETPLKQPTKNAALCGLYKAVVYWLFCEIKLKYEQIKAAIGLVIIKALNVDV